MKTIIIICILLFATQIDAKENKLEITIKKNVWTISDNIHSAFGQVDTEIAEICKKIAEAIGKNIFGTTTNGSYIFENNKGIIEFDQVPDEILFLISE